MSRIGGRFTRSEPRGRARECRACCRVWSVRTAGRRPNVLVRWGPDGTRRLLRKADRDIDGVRDDVRAYVVEHLGDPAAVVVADDTGFLKKGTNGTWRKRFSRPRVRPGWITTRSAAIGPGRPISPCPCSPWPGWLSRKPSPQKGTRRPRRSHARPDITGDPARAGPGIRVGGRSYFGVSCCRCCRSPSAAPSAPAKRHMPPGLPTPGRCRRGGIRGTCTPRD